MNPSTVSDLEELLQRGVEGTTIAARFRFPTFLVDDPSAARRVAEVLARPCLARLERVAAKKGDQLVMRTNATASGIAAHLAEHAFEGVVLENAGEGVVVASAEFPNGQHARSWPASPVGCYGYVAVPFVATDTNDVVRAACDLAIALDARSGAITVEPDYHSAQRWALESPRPKERTGLSARRIQERRAHRRFEDDLATRVAGPEWGLFLGPGHLQHLDRRAIAAAAARVEEVSSSLLYVQASFDPLDDFTDAFDATLDALRGALAPVLMDLSRLDA